MKPEEILTRFENGLPKDEAVKEINDLLSSFQKNRLDILNWAKSELKKETRQKLTKTATPYRREKIRFLRRLLSWLSDEG